MKKWLAGKIGYSPEHVRGVAAGFHPASARFRAACASLFGMPERDLFDEHGDSSAPPGREGDARAATAVRAGYPRPAGLSTLKEAPPAKTA